VICTAMEAGKDGSMPPTLAGAAQLRISGHSLGRYIVRVLRNRQQQSTNASWPQSND
jgi:hypothetical protein